MKKLIIGTNLIEDCEYPFVIASTPLFSYSTDTEGIKINFDVNSPPAKSSIHVKNNQIIEGHVEIKTDHEKASISLLGEKKNINIFELFIEKEIATIKIDLRPLALHIHTDNNALNIGGAQLSGNVIKHCTNAIYVGDK